MAVKDTPNDISKVIDPELIEKALKKFKSSEEADLFIKALEELVGIGKSKIEDDLRSIDFIEKPVDMYTFMKDSYFLGIIDTVYPKLVDDLIELFDPGNAYYLVLLGGSIGWGKSSFSEIAMAMVLYEVSCLKNPQQTYRMVKEDKLFFATVSITHTQAKRVIFEGLKGKIKGSEYFRTVFPYQDFATELRFPNNILLAASTQSQVIGMNTFSAVMDEANFMPVVERSTTAKLRGSRKVYDQAEVVFTALLRRMETRYLRFGNLPGKLFALSSAQYPDDFMERKMDLYQGNKNVFVRNYAVWETKPEGTYGNEKFYIIFNRESGLGRIKKEDEEVGPEEDTIEVPLEFKHDFEVDMEGSLRDLAGRPTLAIEPFLTKRDMIVKMYEDGRRHPFSVYETTLRDGGYVLRDIVCQWVKEEDDVGNVIFEGLKPKVNPKARRFIHIDHGLTGDACFPAGTKIRTPDGAFKRIEQIIIGDEVVTHSGRSQKVVKLWKREAEDLVSISTVGGKEVKCTKNHPILCFRKRQIEDNWEAFHVFKTKRPVPNFVRAEDIEVGDYLVVPIQSYNDVADLNCNGHRLILDYDLGWVFGIFLAEGHYLGHARLEKKWGIAFSLNQKEEKYAEEIIRIFREKFLVSKWNIFRRHDSKSMTLRFPMNRIVADLFKWACSEYYHSKILNPTLIRNGNVNFYSGIIHGWICGDGTGMVRNKKSDRIPNCVSGKTVSEKLAWQLEQLYLRIGLKVRLYNVKSLGGKCKLPGYQVSVFGEDIRFFGFSPFFNKKRSMSLIFDGYMIVPVKSKSFVLGEYEVFNLTVGEENTYVANGVAVHNCGFCMGHVSHYEERMRWRTVQEIDPVGLQTKTKREAFVEMLPMIYIDLWLRIVPPVGGEIILGDIRQLIFELKGMGFRIGLITMDSFQSKDTQQQLKEKGFSVDELSVDVNPEPYNRLKMALYEGRIKGYLHPVGVNELRQLEWNKRKGKVDHRPKGCFTGETRVALLDGTVPTFEELGGRFENGEVFHVYTMSDAGITVGRAHSPRITRQNAPIVEVVFDNFQVIRCTPDHLFMLTDGNYVEASNLTPDMRLMPLYRVRTEKGGWVDYETYYDPVSKASGLLTHHMVAKWKFGGIPNGMIVHHVDGNRGNNEPGNLVLEDRAEHARRHTIKRHRTDEEWVKRLREGHESYRANGGNQKSRENILKLFKEGRLRSGRTKCVIVGCEDFSHSKGMCGNHYQFFRRQKKRSQNHQENHRILSIQDAGYADVWDLTVEDTQNFALASGVFVHNSKDMADALAGVIHYCETRKISEPAGPSLGMLESPADETIKRVQEELCWLLGKPKEGGK